MNDLAIKSPMQDLDKAAMARRDLGVMPAAHNIKPKPSCQTFATGVAVCHMSTGFAEQGAPDVDRLALGALAAGIAGGRAELDRL